MEDVLVCTSEHCEYKEKCKRANPDYSKYNSRVFYNFEYTCNENSGFCDYISILNKKK